MPARGPSRPLLRLVRSWVAALQLVPPLPGDRRPLTHCPRREVASGPATRGVPTPQLLGDLLWQLRPLSLWVASPGVLSQPPLSSDRSLGRRPFVLSRLLSYSVGVTHD